MTNTTTDFETISMRSAASLVPGKIYRLGISTNMIYSDQKFDGRLPGFKATAFLADDCFMFVEARRNRSVGYDAYAAEVYAFLGPNSKIYELNRGQVHNFFFFDYNTIGNAINKTAK